MSARSIRHVAIKTLTWRILNESLWMPLGYFNPKLTRFRFFFFASQRAQERWTVAVILLLYDSAKKKAAKLNVGLESWFGFGYGLGVWVWISMVAGKSFCYILADQIHQNPSISATLKKATFLMYAYVIFSERKNLWTSVSFVGSYYIT